MGKLLRLIIVEDSEDDTLLLLRELMLGGYDTEHLRVVCADDLKRALASGPWDLVISDHALPGFSAPEALVTLKDSGLDTPFIIVSSIIGEDVAVAAMKAGAHDYIMKDSLARLVPVVERVLYDAGVRAERKKAKETLLQSEARFRHLAESAQDLVYRISLVPKRCFDYVSPSAKTILGYSPEDFYSEPSLHFEVVHPDDRHLLDKIARGDVPVTRPLALRWIHKDGKIVWTEQRNVPVCDKDGNLIAIEGIARDITERVIKEQQLEKSHAQIEALSGRILSAMEEERARLARELHDELGQALTAVKLDLQLFGDGFSSVQHEDKRLKQSIELVDYTIDLVRRQSVSLRPPVLDDMGLLPAVKEMGSGFMSRTGIKTIITGSGFSGRLPGHVETALYRCIQESLTNVARHSGAQKVSVELKRDNGYLLLTIDDDGVGFEPEKIKYSSYHIGLTGMQERVKLLSGELSIKSEAGCGVSVFIKVPYSP